MSQSRGTGQPIHFRCSQCRRRYGRHYPEPGHAVVRTGRTRPKNDGNAGMRSMTVEHEYECKDCHHVGWSRHVDILRKPLRGILPT